MRTGVLGAEHGLNLDGILQYAAFLAYCDLPEQERWHLGRMEDQNPVDFELPVARWTMPAGVHAGELTGDDELDALAEFLPRAHPSLLNARGELWGWCTSSALGEPAAKELVAYRGKSPVQEALTLTQAARVNIATGLFKGIDLAYEAHITNRLTWHVLGDASAVCALLKRVTYIGKKHNVGGGAVMIDALGHPLWTVEEVEDGDRDMWCVHGGRLVRHVPVGWPNIATALTEASVRAPNHHPSRQLACHTPAAL